ncbi:MULTISPECIES: cysteine desulfurase family protein [Bacillus amyloliquefaciens group]|uniref:cysteine desulfurase family protein n=1 Tax=Bacillus amyloliquefaciens group TaxID=1938374 RepID=UPI0013622CC2|nr:MULTISPECIES: cysteine desulfurase family protein [Bacillus amyloliquefaciens group]MBO3651155.1 cysteine desulfurase [Bacillus amyloliquefaciens]MCJ2173450.1 cysteine desulfurase [Bacillus amyloliquefaciens]MCR4348751.1 cysteine desulfurase [Bacillus amyloliquefaciens]MCR4356212.1 cysteine desulfurase [Bacillus amyloliquefaciens]MDX7983178.1 cysteine desulfurase family protein [Bacillus velezensis]
MERIYLDHAATSPMDERVLEEMKPHFFGSFGNPSSIHSFGRESRKWVDEARADIAREISAKEQEIIFTSGGTEADNLAIFGTAAARKNEGKHIITTAVEHHAVLHACEKLEEDGFEVTYLIPGPSGRISANQVKEALRDDTILVTVMYGNNEVGTIQPIDEIGELLSGHQAYFHTDAVQAFGYMPIDVKKSRIDMLSVSGHKLNGPKGTGFLYVNQEVKLSPILLGGEQERKRRAGTENVPGIAGLREAVVLSNREREEKTAKYKEFKNIIMSTLEKSGVTAEVNGDAEKCLPHILNLYFPGVPVEALLVNLDMEGVAVSSGSACTAGSVLPSHVLTAMFGSESGRLTSSIRLSFGLGNTAEQIETAAEKLAAVVKRLA